MTTIDLQDVWAYALRVSGEPGKLAEHVGIAAGHPAFDALLRSMTVSGFLVTSPSGNGYRAARKPPSGPEGRVTVDDGRPAQSTTSAAAHVVSAPSGVVPGVEDEQAAPDAARPAPPDGFRYAEPGNPNSRVLEVVDDRIDRIAKAGMLEALHPLLQAAAFYRQGWENDDLPDDMGADDVVGKLLDAIDTMADQAGYGVVGDVDDTQDYDPERHKYCGTLPPSGMTAEVWLNTTGRTWTHRGVTHVLQQAYVALVDDDMGAFSIENAGDLEHEDGGDPEVYLWFDDNSPVKPETYKSSTWMPNGGDWYRLTKAVQASDLFSDCAVGECDHVKDDQGGCDAMLMLFEDADDFLVMPYQELVTSQSATGS